MTALDSHTSTESRLHAALEARQHRLCLIDYGAAFPVAPLATITEIEIRYALAWRQEGSVK